MPFGLFGLFISDKGTLNPFLLLLLLFLLQIICVTPTESQVSFKLERGQGWTPFLFFLSGDLALFPQNRTDPSRAERRGGGKSCRRESGRAGGRPSQGHSRAEASGAATADQTLFFFLSTVALLNRLTPSRFPFLSSPRFSRYLSLVWFPNKKEQQKSVSLAASLPSEVFESP